LAPGAPAEVTDAVSAPVGIDAPATPESALQRAQTALAENDRAIAGLVAERNAGLLAEEVNETEIERLDAELARHQGRQRTLTDRLSLLAEAAQLEAAEQAAQAREAKIVETERIFIERDAAVADLRDHLVAAEAAFRRVHELGLEARGNWGWPHGTTGATLTAASDLVREVSSFLFKVGGRPSQTGGQHQPDTPPAFPGGRCPKIELLQRPDALPDLAAQYRDASKYASNVMRGVRVDAAPASPPVGAPQSEAVPSNVERLPSVSPIHAAPNVELARVLRRQNELASRDMSPDDEAEYAANGEAIKALSA
jgi:hypothetical protein